MIWCLHEQVWGISRISVSLINGLYIFTHTCLSHGNESKQHGEEQRHHQVLTNQDTFQGKTEKEMRAIIGIRHWILRVSMDMKQFKQRLSNCHKKERIQNESNSRVASVWYSSLFPVFLNRRLKAFWASNYGFSSNSLSLLSLHLTRSINSLNFLF